MCSIYGGSVSRGIKHYNVGVEYREDRFSRVASRFFPGNGVHDVHAGVS